MQQSERIEFTGNNTLNSCGQLNDEQNCPYCQSIVQLIWVHGHYQCPKCKYVVTSCCGDS